MWWSAVEEYSAPPCFIGCASAVATICGLGRLITYENDPAYFAFEHTFQSRQHRIRFVDDWDKIKIPDQVSVVFIDHHPPERRMVETLRFKDVADYIVIHDTERPSRKYNLPEVFAQFKYRYDWKECRPWTSVLSQRFDVEKFLK